MPKVSVIVPNYNHSKYLAKRIDSILNQSFQDFELIILDDKSPDDSKTVIEQYRNHPKVSHIVYNEVNSGSTFKQWNKGVALATGEWIWLAESDDYCDPPILETLLAIASKNTNVGLVFANSYFVDEVENKITNPYEAPDAPVDPKYILDFTAEGRTFCGQNLLSPIISNASSAIFKRELFVKIGGADASYIVAGDSKMWHELLLYTDLGYTAQKLNYFRHHTNNVTSTKAAKYILLETSRSTFDILRKLSISKEELEKTKIMLFRQWVFWTIRVKKTLPLNHKIKITYLLLRKDNRFLIRILLLILSKLFNINFRWI